MKGKELKALITLAGKIDPSVQKAMLQASKASMKTSSSIQKAFSAMGKGISKSLSAVNKGVLGLAGKISPSFQSGLTKVEAGASKTFSTVQKGAQIAGKGVLNAGKVVGKGFEIAGKAAKVLTIGVAAVGTVATAAIAPLAGQGLEYASSLTEVQNVVDTTFGKSASVIGNFSKTSLQSFGLSSLQAKQYSSTLGAMYKSMGLSSQQTLTMSQNMTALAGDMASFYNLDPSEAFEKIRSGVSGETEPLKELGINMSEANLQAFAMSKGIKTSYQNMTQAQQAALRYNYLLSVTKDAQGDFAKTSGSFANQQRLLKVNLQQTAGQIMTKVMPALGAGMQQVNKFVTGLDPGEIGNAVGSFASTMVSFLPQILRLLPSIGSAMSSLLPIIMQIAPLVGNLIQMILPAISQMAPMIGSMLQMVLPALINIAQQVMPILILAVQTFMAVLQPLLPPIIQIVQQLLPPLMQVLTAVSPLLITIAKIVGAVLGPALSLIVGWISKLASLISTVAKPLNGILSSVASFFGIGGQQQKAVTAGSSTKGISIPKYANGGFADSPSVFGDAGLEAAIPIRPGSARSLGLLAKTARLLGMKDRASESGTGESRGMRTFPGKVFGPGNPQRAIHFTYAPKFYGERPTESVLKRDAQNLKRVLDDYFGDRGRFAWE